MDIFKVIIESGEKKHGIHNGQMSCLTLKLVLLFFKIGIRTTVTVLSATMNYKPF